MSGISTSHPVAILRTHRGLDVETYASELDCVLQIINNGSLGRAIDPRMHGWASEPHREAVKRVIAHAQEVLVAIDEQIVKDNAS
ncbi:hypothetical protein QFZ42_003347 [Variovorax paradoxus]|uniref:hypothetical protein n=1 Tax=Variovorax paradoxus TaxID=34073 RepID=UPI0027903A85|nr:hypothetical protein [Variovorax paradoxus]MDQ0571513.1 hypothetical protein [Variovorax paradoxus]